MGFVLMTLVENKGRHGFVIITFFIRTLDWADQPDAAAEAQDDRAALPLEGYNNLHDRFPRGTVSYSRAARLLLAGRRAPASKRAAGCFPPALLPLWIRSRSRRAYHRPRSGTDRSFLGQPFRAALRPGQGIGPDSGEP